MAQFLNTEDLITSIKTRTLCPSSQQTFSTSNITQFINEELQISMVPWITSIHEDFFLKKKVQALSNSIEHYIIPERAIGNALACIYYLDSSSNRFKLDRINLGNLYNQSLVSNTPYAYRIENDRIVVIPDISTASGSLEIWYYSRPNEIVATSACAKITSIATSGSNKVYTVDTDLTGSLNTSSYVDILSGKSPFVLWGEDVAVQAITSTTITLPMSDIDDDAGTALPVVNDYICPAKKSNIAMIPQEAHPILAQMVAARIVEALGDVQKLESIYVKLADMKKSIMDLIANRVEDSVEHVVHKNGLVANIQHNGPYTWLRVI